jgi:ketosteroid isomerase-like protein
VGKSQIAALLVAGVFILATGCEMAGGLSDEAQLTTVLEQWEVATEAQDLDRMMEQYSDDYEDSGGEGGKEGVRQFLTQVMDEGDLEDIDMDIGEAEINIEGDKATVAPIIYTGNWGEVQMTYDFKKESDGVWRVVGSEEYNMQNNGNAANKAEAREEDKAYNDFYKRVEADNFYAYYTKIDSGEKFEKYSHAGKYADIVVNLSQGKLVFHRSSSYLPYWQTEKGRWYVDEIVKRSGDGPAKRPDKNNLYAFARIIEDSPERIVIHWRYFPNFKLGAHKEPIGGNAGFDGVVHEYFTISPDGDVTHVIREGTKKLDDWNDPLNRTTQKLKLAAGGITSLSITKPRTSTSKIPAVKGAPVLEFEVLETEYENEEIEGEETDYDEYQNLRLAASFSFDDALKSRTRKFKDKAYESISRKYFDVEGHKSVWKKGISGTALGFDGYYSKVSIPRYLAPKINRDFALEAWVAPGAYSICSWTAIVHQSEWKAIVADPYIFTNGNWGAIQVNEEMTKGYFIGIDEKGHVGFFVKMGPRVEKLVSDEILELNKWSHVAVTFSDGTLRLFINGKISDFTLSGEMPDFADADFVVGLNDDRIGYVSQHVVRRFSTFPSRLGFEGLIDEVKLYTGSMMKEHAMAQHDDYKLADRRADLEPRRLPGHPGLAKKFGAYYTKLKYHDLWDNMWREGEHPDIVVKFDELPTSVVFWRGNRNPGWVTDTNKWICDQSTELTEWHWEDRGNGCQSCCEHMSDYQARHSHVRIIENTDARVLVHWRYASVDVLYKHPLSCEKEDGWGVWTDEYIYIYPDGVGTRTVDSYHHLNGGIERIGFHDTQFLSEAGTKPEDNINLQALTIVEHNDKIHELDWSDGHPSGGYDAQVAWVNLKSDYKVFEVFPPKSTINVWAGDEKTSYSKYSAWNHYPVTQAPCDGRFCVAPDRLTHSALGACDNLAETGSILIYGFTNKKADALIPLAKSWNDAPVIKDARGCSPDGYEKSQRAYVLTAESPKMSFTIDASSKKPVVNLCLVIKNWQTESNAAVKIDGKTQRSGSAFRQGNIRDTNGTLTKIIWLKTESTSPVKMEISGGAPK